MEPIVVPHGLQGEARLVYRICVLEGVVDWVMCNMINVISKTEMDRIFQRAEAQVREEYEVDDTDHGACKSCVAYEQFCEWYSARKQDDDDIQRMCKNIKRREDSQVVAPSHEQDSGLTVEEETEICAGLPAWALFLPKDAVLPPKDAADQQGE